MCRGSVSLPCWLRDSVVVFLYVLGQCLADELVFEVVYGKRFIFLDKLHLSLWLMPGVSSCLGCDPKVKNTYSDICQKFIVLLQSHKDFDDARLNAFVCDPTVDDLIQHISSS